MIKFQKEFDYCNLSSKLKGKGIKCAIFEYNTLDQDYGNVTNPVPYYPVDRFDYDYNKNHGWFTSKLSEYKTDGEFYVLPNRKSGVDWAIENGVNLVIASVSSFASGDLNKLAEQAIMLTAVGNHGRDEDHEEDMLAQMDKFIGVGAVRLINGKPRIESYSSWGLSKVEIVGFSGLRVWDDMRKFYGSSCACPFFGLSVMDFMEMYKEQTEVFPLNKQVKEILIDKYAQDLFEVGDDLRSGKGIVIMPDQLDLDVIKIKFTKGESVASEIIKNDEIIEYEDVMPQIMTINEDGDGRTMVPLHFVKELMNGIGLHWNSETREVVLTQSKEV